MSDRERWIVYPILFFTLAIVLKDKLPPKQARELECGQITCGRLAIADGGSIEIYGHDNVPLMRLGTDEEARMGLVDLRGVDGQHILLSPPHIPFIRAVPQPTAKQETIGPAPPTKGDHER